MRCQQLLWKKHALVIDGFLNHDGERYNYNKTGGEDNPRFRVALLPDITIEMLLNYICENCLKENDYIFQHNKSPVRSEYAESEFARALKNAQIETSAARKITPHALRYTYITRTRRLIDSNAVMMMAGHSSIEMTEWYTRPELEENADALAVHAPKINGFFA